MGGETELKLALPAAAAARLRKHPLLAAQRPQRQHLANTYYDTPARDIKKRRIALRHRHTAWGQLLTVKSAEPAPGGLARRNEWEAPSLPGVFDFSHVDDKALRRWLEAVAPALQTAFATDFVRTTWTLEPAPGTRVEVALDQGAVRCGEAIETICEVELELLAGPVSALFEIALALQADLPLRPALESKAERGYRLFEQGRLRLRPVKAGRAAIDKGMTPLAAFRLVALSCIDHLQRNEAGARAGDDPEFVHQARVAIRRLRSALRFWCPCLPESFRAQFAPAWRALAATLGEARNLDVFVSETLPPLEAAFPDRPSLACLQQRVGRRRDEAQKRVRQAFDDPQFARLLLVFTAAVYALDEAPGVPAGEGRAVESRAVSLTDFARRRLRRLARAVAALAARNDGSYETCHRLRIACKRLRYALEFVAPLYGAAAVRRQLAAVAELQALLGALNDRVVAGSLVAGLLRRDDDGLVHGWLAGQAALLAAQLPAALAAFTAAPPPWRAGR